jgi:hypothetical protein
MWSRKCADGSPNLFRLQSTTGSMVKYTSETRPSGETPRGQEGRVYRDAAAQARRAHRAVEDSGVSVPQALAVLPRARRMDAQRVARYDSSCTHIALPPKTRHRTIP